MTKYVDISDAAETIWNEIEDWSNNLYLDLDKACDVSIKEARKEIKNLSRGTKKNRKGAKKHYVSTFTTRKPKEMARQLWNRKYQLSHLLEDGHEVYNQYGGPYNIKKRTAGVGSNVRDSRHTSDYDMWKNTYDYLEEFFLNEVKKTI